MYGAESSRKREEQEQRRFVEMSIEFKDTGKSRMPGSWRAKGRKGRQAKRAKWDGASDSRFPPSAGDTIRRGGEVASLSCVPFLDDFTADSQPAAMTDPIHTELGKSRSWGMRVCE